MGNARWQGVNHVLWYDCLSYEERTGRERALDWDLVVVGASSAGLYAACRLREAGKRVAVFEQAQIFNPARRTLIVTPHLRRTLPNLDARVTRHHINELVLASPAVETSVTLRDPDLIIERRALIETLVQQAQAAGVALYWNRRFRAIRAEGEGVELVFQTAQGECLTTTARAIIGADGVFSDVARVVRLKHPPSVPILQAEIELPPHWNPNVTQVWFDTDETRFFYWLIPESGTRAVVGLVSDERAQMRHVLTRFLDRHGFKALAYQGARIALYHPKLKPATRVGQAPVLLVGDAAGQVKVTTVGGTVSGLLGADAAVQAVLQNRSYTRELRPLKRELELHWWMRAALDRLDNRDYDRLVRNVSSRLREFLGAHTRDEMADVAWQLAFLQPQLVSLVPHLLLRSLWRRNPQTGLPAPAQE
ncbi:MAG TPA: NAD(P)/FAD-dependent oxidoreductase [Anaerolineae bacterium]|nr:NAD(P)/FAD-dependent oxidoreductase [Anaerolineae bacterium]